MSGISTHVLDLTLGKPAAGIPVLLDRRDGGKWERLAAEMTDTDGRCRELLPATGVVAGAYRLTFVTEGYFLRNGASLLYPEITLIFQIAHAGTSYHMPVLLSPNGYTTYRGS